MNVNSSRTLVSYKIQVPRMYEVDLLFSFTHLLYFTGMYRCLMRLYTGV